MNGRIALVSMPFASSRRPSIQLGLLAGLARSVGWQAEPQHLSLEFAALLGRDRYEALCQHRGTLLSEWVFAGAAFDTDNTDIDLSLAGYELELTGDELGMDAKEARAWLRRVRVVLVPAFIDALIDSTDWSRFAVVAFTSTFQQNVASFALARRLKAQFGVTTLFGGANFDGDMGREWVRTLDFIDYAAIGEGDRSLPAFLQAMDRGHPHEVPGIASRAADGAVRLVEETSPYSDLDALPVPDYDDYFDRTARLGILDSAGRTQVDLPFETARGCWWGQKHHCIFCGLNSQTMKFRSKSPQRAALEIQQLSSRYRSLALEAVDNIMDLTYLSSVLPEVASQGYSYEIFFETKANLDPDQLGAMAAAGVHRIQPGIESLSTPLLQVMRKGTTGIRNVAFLKWCRRFGIRPSWNLLWGFPGERPDDYAEQVRTIGQIPHLQPPDGEGRLWLERFSPMFTDGTAFGVRDVRPLASYSSVYPPSIDLDAAAYFFEYEMDGSLPDSAFEDLRAALAAWRESWSDPAQRPYLSARSGPGFVEVVEGRPGRETGVYLLEDSLAAVHRACERRPTALRVVAQQCGIAEEEATEVAAALAERGLILQEGTYVLALAVPA